MYTHKRVLLWIRLHTPVLKQVSSSFTLEHLTLSDISSENRLDSKALRQRMRQRQNDTNKTHAKGRRKKAKKKRKGTRRKVGDERRDRRGKIDEGKM